MDTESVSFTIERDAESVDSPAVCPESTDFEGGAQKMPAPTLTRNTKYYLSLVTLRVGNQLFRVPREGFMNRSQVFCDMFNISPSNDKGQEGESDENPIILEQIDEGAFEDLLQLLYPDRPNGGLLLRVSGESVADRWLNVLGLAHMWQLKDIRDHCIEKLEEYGLDVIRTIVVAHKYEITQWYANAYLELARRREPLTFDESQHFTKDFMVKLARVREREIARKSLSLNKPADEELEEDVRRIFLGIKPALDPPPLVSSLARSPPSRPFVSEESSVSFAPAPAPASGNPIFGNYTSPFFAPPKNNPKSSNRRR